MKPTICSRCKKNIAVYFITKVENGVSTNEGLCLKCARELKIKQVDDIVERMGITDEDLDNLNGEMMAMMQPEPDETERGRDRQPHGDIPAHEPPVRQSGRGRPARGAEGDAERQDGKAQGEETQVPRHLLPEPHGPCPRR